MQVNIGLLGTGCVGTGVLKILQEKSATIKKRTGTEVCINKILYRSHKPDKIFNLPDNALTKNYNEILDDDNIDIIVELIGGYEPADEIISSALKKGKSVVTANKAIIARHLPKYNQLASEYGGNLEFEAAVAGSIPILNSIKTSFSADNVHSVYAILNGTTNFILTRMLGGLSFDEALALAQKKGFAEADPSFDLDGKDSAQKIGIIAMIAFNTAVGENIYTEGIRSITKEDLQYAAGLGYIIKLIAVAKKSDLGAAVTVHPTLIPETSPLAPIRDEFNAVFMRSDNIDDALLLGKGAGQMPTAATVVADIVRVASRLKYGTSRPPVAFFNDIPLTDPMELKSKFYIRYGVMDKVGILARIAEVLGNNNVSIAGVWQKKTVQGVVSLVMTTHSARVKDVLKSVEIIDASSDLVRGKSLAIRIDDMEG